MNPGGNNPGGNPPPGPGGGGFRGFGGSGFGRGGSGFGSASGGQYNPRSGSASRGSGSMYSESEQNRYRQNLLSLPVSEQEGASMFRQQQFNLGDKARQPLSGTETGSTAPETPQKFGGFQSSASIHGGGMTGHSGSTFINSNPQILSQSETETRSPMIGGGRTFSMQEEEEKGNINAPLSGIEEEFKPMEGEVANVVRTTFTTWARGMDFYQNTLPILREFESLSDEDQGRTSRDFLNKMKQEMRSRAKSKQMSEGDFAILKGLFSSPLEGITTQEDVDAFSKMFEFRGIDPGKLKSQKKRKPPVARKEQETEWKAKTYGSDEDY